MQLTKEKSLNVSLQVAWAMREWSGTVGCILSQLSNEVALQKVGLWSTASCADDEDSVARKRDDAEVFCRLVVAMAAQRCWSMSLYSELPPRNWAGILCDDAETLDEQLARIKRDHDVIFLATCACSEADVSREEAQAFVVIVWPLLRFVSLLITWW